MGEIGIDPKFNIHETYKKVRILNPYRNSGISLTYEVETTAYMYEINIPNDATIYYAGKPQEATGSNLWTYIDDFIKREKLAGRWVNILYFRPRIKGTALAHSINLIDTTKFQGTYFGGWTHNELGSTGDGTSGYMTTGFNPSLEQISGQSGMGASLLDYTGTNVTGIMGCRNGSSDASEMFTPGNSYDFLFRYNAGNIGLLGSTPDLYGVQVLNRISSTSKLFYNGIEKKISNGAGSLQNLEMYEGRINNLAGYNIKGRLGCTFQISNFTDVDCIDFSASVEQLELDLKRKTW